MSRRKPYTQIGIRRMACERCGQPGRTQWQICADDRVYRILCARCDIELNELVVRWVWGKRREKDLKSYRQKMEAA